jgi:hypothetical protein
MGTAGLHAVATAKTASTSITRATARVISLGFDADGKRVRKKVSG